MAGQLYIVPTPLGNLGDMTARALEVLEQVDVVCAEDTRVTGKLLAHFGIHAKLERCDENVISQRTPDLVARLQAGESIAFCSDAGMPGVSDPGITLVDACIEAGVPVDVLPGPSAVITALVASGLKAPAFYFGGFFPRKHEAQMRLLEPLVALDAALVFYESPHRIAAAIGAVAQAYGTREVALCRELTKLHQEVLRLPANELAENLRGRDVIKGEIAFVIAPPDAAQLEEDALNEEALLERIKAELVGGTPKSALAKSLAKELGLPKNRLYDLVHQASDSMQ